MHISSPAVPGLPLAKFWYNSAFHTAICCSPFKALYGYDPNLGLSMHLDTLDNFDAVNILKERKLQTALLREQLARAQNRMKTQADKMRTDRSFHVGNQVLIKL